MSALAEEALRVRHHPGIAFAGPPGDGRARVEGTGLDVWEVITVHRTCQEDIESTQRVLEHLSLRQIEAALRYYRAYPGEIDAPITENERSQEEWERLHPHVVFLD